MLGHGARSPHRRRGIQPLLDAAFDRARTEVASEDELARAKARLELGSLQQLETVGGKAEQIGFFETVLGDPAHAFRRVEAYRRVTAGDLRRVARRYLVDTSRTVVRVRPEDARSAAAAPAVSPEAGE